MLINEILIVKQDFSMAERPIYQKQYRKNFILFFFLLFFQTYTRTQTSETPYV